MTIVRWTAVGVMGIWLGVGPEGWAQEAPPEVTVEEVVVTATRQEEEVLRVPSHVTVITQEEIKQSNVTNVGDLLRTEAGLWVTNGSGSTPTSIFIDSRGFNNGGGNGSRILVLIDGRRVNLADTSNPDWATIPVESIERIEIVRGSSTALYGDNAVVGVINIITKQGASEPIVHLSLERGSYDYWNRKATLSGTDGSLSYYLYGGYESTEGFRENSDYRAENEVGNFGFKISPFSTIRFRSSYLSNERLLPGSLTREEMAEVGRDGSVTPEDLGGTHQAQLDMVFDSYLDKHQWIELTAGQTLRGAVSRITIPGAGFTDLNDDGRSTALASQYRMTGQMSGRESRLTLGVDLLKERVKAESFNNYPDPLFPFVATEITQYERRLIGAYIHEEFSIHPAVIFTLSGRVDWSHFEFSRMDTDHTTNTTTESSGDRSFHVWSPKAGLTYLISSSTSLFATWSRSFRFPNRDELTGFFGFTPELDPERATTYEVGGMARIGRQLEGNLSVFRTQVKDEILFIPPDLGEFAFGENQNVLEVKHEGIEVSAAVRPSESVRLKGSYTFTRTKILKGPFEDNELPITPKHAGTVTLDWGRGKGWMLSVTGRFSGKRFLANDLANEQEKLQSYTVIDTRLAYFADSFEAFFGINNVLDREYEEFGGVGGFPFGDRIGFNPSPERNFIGGATLRF